MYGTVPYCHVPYCTWSGASQSRNILHSAGRKVLGGQDSKQRSTLSDMRSSMQSCSRAMSCISLSSPAPLCNHSSRVSGSTSLILKKNNLKLKSFFFGCKNSSFMFQLWISLGRLSFNYAKINVEWSGNPALT